MVGGELSRKGRNTSAANNSSTSTAETPGFLQDVMDICQPRMTFAHFQSQWLPAQQRPVSIMVLLGIISPCEQDDREFMCYQHCLSKGVNSLSLVSCVNTVNEELQSVTKLSLLSCLACQHCWVKQHVLSVSWN